MRLRPTAVRPHYALRASIVEEEEQMGYLKNEKFIHLIFVFCNYVLFYLLKYINTHLI